MTTVAISHATVAFFYPIIYDNGYNTPNPVAVE